VCSWQAEGSYSRLFRAEDERARPCAVKLARAEVADAASRLEREATIRREFCHAGVPEMRDTGEVAGLPFLALAWVEGITLRVMLDGRRGLPLVRTLEIARDVADVIAGMHSVGLAHGDLRADNVLIARSGPRAALLADLGSACRRGEPCWQEALAQDRRRLAGLLFHMLAGVSSAENPGALSAARGHHPGAVSLWEAASGGEMAAQQFLRELDDLHELIRRPLH
jgi:serine/threonine protein kinase